MQLNTSIVVMNVVVFVYLVEITIQTVKQYTIQYQRDKSSTHDLNTNDEIKPW